eukprot:scaffold3827_cov191-Ochromonas_danica.AAC.2
MMIKISYLSCYYYIFCFLLVRDVVIAWQRSLPNRVLLTSPISHHHLAIPCHAASLPKPSYRLQPLRSGIIDTILQPFQAVYHSEPVVLAEQALASASPPVEEATTSSTLDFLGNDLLIFLCATIGIVPLFKWLKASPVLGFLSAGLLMGPAGLHLFSDLSDMESLADFGVLFLLFEQGLELTVSRLKSVSKFAFGMGSLQVLLSSAAFFVFPFLGGVHLLEFLTWGSADPAMVDISRVDEALVIGIALSLSSSAFVLQLLQEKGKLGTATGEASLGILLLQDLAVVPLLVLLPILEQKSDSSFTLQAVFVLLTFAKALFGLSVIQLIGGRIIRFLFSMVARTKSSETFIALCLLVAVGLGAFTNSIGLSATLGAFLAGTLLAESNYRTQIESDIKPFKGLLLGLFFLTTGASVDPHVLGQAWPTVLALLFGLLSFKTIITTCLGPFFGLSKGDSIRTGLLLAGGGEFAFVVLTLADRLQVLPSQLAKVLVGVVVLSMALTPALGKLGDWLAEKVESLEKSTAVPGASLPAASSILSLHDEVPNPVVICGFGEVGREVALCLEQRDRLRTSQDETSYEEPSSAESVAGRPPIRFADRNHATDSDPTNEKHPNLQYLAFDLDPKRVSSAYQEGLRVLYGDGSRPLVLATAGVTSPRAFVLGSVAEDSKDGEGEDAVKCVQRLRLSFPNTPIFVRSSTQEEAVALQAAGATVVCYVEREAAYSLARSLMQSLEQLDVQASGSSKRGDDLVEASIAAIRKQALEEDKTALANISKPSTSSASFQPNGEEDRSLRDRLESFGPVRGLKRLLGPTLTPTAIHYSSLEETNEEETSVEQEKGLKEEELGVTICEVPSPANDMTDSVEDEFHIVPTSTESAKSVKPSSSSGPGAVPKERKDTNPMI